jgi:hypothetical protein
MNKSRSLAVLVVPVVLLVSACANPTVRIRAADSMFNENPAKKIAVVSSARISWPRMGRGNEAGLGFAESKQVVERITPDLCKALNQKGYETVYCAPVGIGFYNPALKENLVFEKDGGGKEWNLKDNEPAYLYPAAQNDPKLNQALRNINEKMELDIGKRQWGAFVPEKDDLRVVAQATGADTVCITRVYGRKYSQGRKAGAMAMTVAAAMFGVINTNMPTETTEIALSCTSAASGEVIWQYAKQMSADPVEGGGATVIPAVLEHFPDRSKPLDAKYRAQQKPN